ncbi:MAG TPA: hypothetical protein VFH68_12850 [Polyangia bacterium]|nr:hypothetical protein [Polyangia bacterium]
MPAPAHAQNAPAVEKLIQMNKKALEDYETLEWDTAKRTLLQALVFAKKSNLETHPMMARTYVHLGAVYVIGFKDKQKGLQSFARALEIDPTIRISKVMSTPELEDLFAQAGQGAGAGAAAPPPTHAEPPPGSEPPPPPPSGGRRRRGPIMETEPSPPPPPTPPPRAEDDDSNEPDLPARVNVLECPTKDETPPDRAVLIRCAMAPNLPVSKLFLMYLDPGAEDFSGVPMERTPKGWYAAKIPKKAVVGTSLRFYVEGRNDKGKAIVSNGRSDSPNLMLIRESGAAETEKELGGGRKRTKEENPFDEPDPNRPRRFLGRIDKSKIGLDTRYGNRRWWIGFGLGSGFGFAPSSGLESLPNLSFRYGSGFAWAQLGHIAPEIGYQLGPNMAIALEGRDQYIPQSKHFSSYAATGAHLVLAKFLLYTKQSRARFFGAVAAGGGEGFRLVAQPAAGLAPLPGGDSQYPDFKDTIRGGPVAAGVGGGFIYEISKGVSWMAEVNLLAGFPKFAAVADLNTGFQINFGTTQPPPEDKAVKAPAPVRPVKKKAAQQEDDE